jgi:purine-binding chemotaxis protein CheW
LTVIAKRQSYTSCLVDNLLVGVKVEEVQEVHSGSELTPVPLAPVFVSGLLNLRGEIVTAVDLRRCLQVGERPTDQRPVNLILRTDDGCVSLLVDEVGDVMEVDEQDAEAPPRTLRGRSRELITTVYKLEGRLLLVLDTKEVLAFSASEPVSTTGEARW